MHIDWAAKGLRRKLKRRYRRFKILQRIRRFSTADYHRIYFYHSRKTAGTSLVKMFMSLDGQDGNLLYRKLESQSNRLLIAGSLVFAGWDKQLIEEGEYCFGFSHLPFDDIILPPSTFCLTTFRDPLERLLSHYRMLIDFSKQANPHECFEEEGAWLGSSFDDFLDRIPQHHLLNQLHMFSKCCDIDEAVDRIRSLQHVIYFSSFGDSVAELSNLIKRKLIVRHERKSQYTLQLSENQRRRAIAMLEPEYMMFERLARFKQFDTV